VVIDLGLAWVLGRAIGVEGIATATTVTATANCTILGLLARKLRLPKSRSGRKRLVGLVGVAFATGAAALAVRYAGEKLLGPSQSQPRSLLILSVALAIALGAFAALGAARLLRVPASDEIAALWTRRKL
jgi:peptidoglycan biosynthesis protein MviN/MurJ (putative lipid II flippase)